MAISEDTAALVAAQLTAAWAAHEGPRPTGVVRKLRTEDLVLERYRLFRQKVLEEG